MKLSPKSARMPTGVTGSSLDSLNLKDIKIIIPEETKPQNENNKIVIIGEKTEKDTNIELF